MKTLLTTIALFTATMAMAGVESEIENAVKYFDLPKTGSGVYIKNGAVISNDQKCYVALNEIDPMVITTKNFEITVGGKTTGVDIDGWDNNRATKSVNGDRRQYKVRYETTDDCDVQASITFTHRSVELARSMTCSATSRKKSARMICNY